MLSAKILGVGLRARGLNGWAAGSDVLTGAAPFSNEPMELPTLESVPPRERRRLSPIVRLALAVAQEAVERAGTDPKEMCAVFAWPHGDAGVIQNILQQLCTEDRSVSPTDFHNSVHNVAVGYWSIHTGCQLPCTSISAEIDTFAVSLIKTLAQIKATGRPVLLTITDAPFPEPLNAAYPIGESFAAAFVLAPQANDVGVASLAIALEDGPVDSEFFGKTEAFQGLWDCHAAVRALPVLECLARRADEDLVLPHGPDGGVRIEIRH